MSGLRRRIVLWDTDECKIPASLDAVGAVNNISRALAAKGYHGCREVTAFGEIYTGGNDFFYARIGTRPCDPDDGDKKLDMILVDLLCHAVGNQGRVTFLLILGNNVSGHSVGLIRALRYLKSKKGYGLVLAQANQVSEKLHDVVSHAWLWEDLALGLEPIPPPSRRGYVDVGIEDKVGPFVSANTSVFWNMQDCRIPDGLSAVDVLRNVSSALADKGYADGSVISFYTYGDGNQIKGLEESTGVVVVPCFLPTGDRAAKLDRVLVDFLCCAVDNPQGRNLLLILGDLEGSQFDLAAMLMGDKLYNCLLAQPNDAPQGQLLGAVCEKWRWESLAAGEKPLLPDHRYPQAIIDLDKHLATLALDDEKFEKRRRALGGIKLAHRSNRSVARIMSAFFIHDQISDLIQLQCIGSLMGRESHRDWASKNIDGIISGDMNVLSNVCESVFPCSLARLANKILEKEPKNQPVFHGDCLVRCIEERTVTM